MKIIENVKKKLFINSFKHKYPNLYKSPIYKEYEPYIRQIIHLYNGESELFNPLSIFHDRYMNCKLGITPVLVYRNGVIIDKPYSEAWSFVLEDAKKRNEHYIAIEVVNIVNNGLFKPYTVTVNKYITD